MKFAMSRLAHSPAKSILICRNFTALHKLLDRQYFKGRQIASKKYMKKIFISVFFVVAIASFGGNIVTAHGQTTDAMAPDQTAALQGQIEALETQLADLMLQAIAQG